MKKKAIRLIVLLLVSILVCGSTLTVFAAQTGREAQGVEVTRLEWLKALTKAFEMEVEEDNYPDNYYSDIDSSSVDYYDIMLATEYGLVDVEAGDPLRPGDAATREFAAHTLNLCMGYEFSGGEYTFNEAKTVDYPNDIQIAVDEGWLELSNGNFLPQQGITAAEKDRMISIAVAAVKSTVIDPNYDNQYQLAEGVIQIPEETEVVLTNYDELTLYDCKTKIVAGDIFVVLSDGLPVARKAVSVAVADNNMVVKVEGVDAEEAFLSLDAQGTIQADLTQAQAIGDDVTLAYIVGGTEERAYEDGITLYSLEEVEEQTQQVTAVIATKTIKVPDNGISLFDLESDPGKEAISLSCKITNVSKDYGVDLLRSYAYVKVTGKVTFSCKIGTDKIDIPHLENPFVKVPIGVIGYFEPKAEGTIEGSVSLCLKGNLSVGVQYDHGRVRGIFGFKKAAFTIEAKAEASVGIKVAVGVDLGVLKAELFGKAGAKAFIKITKYTDVKLPERCTHVAAHLYASYGGNVIFKMLGYKTTITLEEEIYNEKNSPVKIALHYEDGKPVSECTRDKESAPGDGSGGGSEGGSGTTGSGKKYKYYTPIDSQYAYSGANTGISSKGEEYTIFEYSLDEESRATITKYNGNVSALNIPDTIDGYTVVGIGKKVFQKNSRLVMVTIPDTVTIIEEGAFGKCTNLCSVTLSKSLNQMGAHAFFDCDNLTSIEIPKSLKSTYTAYIYEFAYDYQYGPFYGCDNLRDITFEKGTTTVAKGLFAHCTGLQKITIPSTVTSIGVNAFEKCTNLQNINFSDAIVTIGDYAFNDCVGLTNVKLPSSLTYMGCFAFGNCDALDNVEIPKSVKEVGVTSVWLGGGPNYRDGGPFTYCSNLKTVTFERGTKAIANNIFTWCPSIEKVEIPDTVTIIGSNAFSNCYNLSSVVMADSVTYIGNGCFGDCKKLSELKLSKNIQTIGYYAFGNCDSLTSITIPNSLQDVYISYNSNTDGVFYGCDNLETVIVEDGTKKVVGYLFSCCTGLKEIVIPDSVTEIERYAFKGCTNLEKLKMPNTVVKLGDSAFDGCTKLSDILISNSVTDIGDYAFQNCKNLHKITLPDGVLRIGRYAFNGCSSLGEIILPDSVTEIGRNIFASCVGLEKVKLPGKIKTISYGAFQTCTALNTIDFPDSVMTIEAYAFQYSGLKKIELSPNLEKINAYAFYNCDALQFVSIPDSVTVLGDHCFADCEILSDVRLGSGLTAINGYTFNLCPGLTKIELPYRLSTVAANAFTNCTNLTEITIPRGTTSIASNAFSYPNKMTVYGVSGTYAEEWAKSEGAVFVNREIPATALTLNHEKLTMNKGTTVGLALTVTPTDSTDMIKWKSNNTSVVTVSDTGVVKAVAAGTATIRVTAGNVNASCEVTVVQPVTSIYLNRTTLNLEAEDTYELRATVRPDNANDKTLTWSSSDEAVAAVDQNGVVTAVKKGTATITVTAKDGSGVSNSCTVTVINSVYHCERAEELESAHNYENNCSDVWTYSVPDAEQIFVTFDNQTDIEKDFDYLYIYDGSGSEVGCYTGTTLSGQTIVLQGNAVRIKLVSDNSGNTWGFKVTDAGEYCEHTYSTIWSSDESCHWHGATCKHTELRKDQEAHITSDWIVDREASTAEAGSRHKECTVCGKVLETEEIERIKTPAEELVERLDSVISEALSTAAVLNDENLTSATEEEKTAAAAGVLQQIETICAEKDISNLSILPAETVLEKVQQLGTVDSRISSLLGTSVTVVAKEGQDGLALPIVQNAILSVPAGENAVIQVAKVETPVISGMEAGNALALSFDMLDSAGKEMELKAPIVITMPVPAGINTEEKIYVYHFRDGETDYSERLPIRLNGDGTMSFVTGSFSMFVVANTQENRKISGTIIGFGSDETIITLSDANMAEVMNVRVAGDSSAYVLENVACGSYTLKVSRKNHAPREYPITVGDGDAVQNLELRLWGDITGDGKINAKDSKGYYNYSAGQLALDDYLFKVGDVNGDGKINAKDVKAIYNHTAGIYMLW